MLEQNRETVDAERALDTRNLMSETFGKALFTSDVMAARGAKYNNVKPPDQSDLLSNQDSEMEDEFGKEYDQILAEHDQTSIGDDALLHFYDLL